MSNKAKDKSNFNVTLHTDKLKCESLYFYGDQADSTQPQSGRENELFEGYFKELKFVSETVDGETYQCKYNYVTADPMPYVYMKISHLPSGDVKMCEIEFDG